MNAKQLKTGFTAQVVNGTVEVRQVRRNWRFYLQLLQQYKKQFATTQLFTKRHNDKLNPQLSR